MAIPSTKATLKLTKIIFLISGITSSDWPCPIRLLTIELHVDAKAQAATPTTPNTLLKICDTADSALPKCSIYKKNTSQAPMLKKF